MTMIHLYRSALSIVVIALLGLTGPAHAELFPRPCRLLGRGFAAPQNAEMACVLLPTVSHAF
jgi:hypothetical protein